MSLSPNGSYVTTTGRPSLWTKSSERRLARLYLYTTLPLNKIVEVIHKTTTWDRDCPGKDSANKKLNAILDKEPRWLHPRTRTDMDRRIHALDSSPTRQTPPPQNALSPSYSRSISTDARPYLSVNQDFKHEAENSPNVNDFQPFSHSRASSIGWQLAATIPLPTLVTTELASPSVPPSEAGIHRSTTTQLQEVLSNYSVDFVRQVSKLLKRYTMPSNNLLNEYSPMDDDRPGTADSDAASWVFENDNAPQMRSETEIRPLPGDFLNLHHHLDRQGGVCFPGLRTHDSRSCYCHVRDELTNECWISGQGPSLFAQHLLLCGEPADGNHSRRDPFGNTILHLLAAGDTPHYHLFQAVVSSPDPSARNSSGQTFMHVLNDSWFAGRAQPLFQLLQHVKRLDLDLYARDVYGRNFCHILHAKDASLIDQGTKNALLKLFDAMAYCRRDAFGNIPESAPASHPVRRAYTSAVDDEISPAWNPHALRQYSSPIGKQASLLKTVMASSTNPRTQDSQGRNGLHCLADTILSQETLLAKFPSAKLEGQHHQQPQQPQQPQKPQQEEKQQQEKQQQQQLSPISRKRKHNKPVLQKSLDSSSERLTVRETTVKNLIQDGVDPNHYDKHGNTVLMAFVAQLPEDDDYKKPVAILEFLIQAGADVNARNRKGETALHIAVRRGKKLAMRTLTQHGANVQARDVEGRSVLDVADRMVVSGKHSIDQPRYEACHAWLSGQGKAVRNPTILEEWAWKGS